MMRLAAAAALVGAAMADTCTFTRTADICPVEGQFCDEKTLCAVGLYCAITQFGTNTYSGRCSVGPKLEDKYQKVCELANEKVLCQFDDPLALTPYSVSSLQCVRANQFSSVGQCLLGPQKDGDGCSQETECASGDCMREIRLCRGVDEGMECVPGFPDPCRAEHFCMPTPSSRAGGTCAKSISINKPCFFASACTRGTFCSGADSSFKNARCLAPFSVDTGANTTIGPYMCKTGNALVLQAGANLANSVYQCVAANSTRVGEACDSRKRAAPGYECKCAEDGQSRLRTVMGLGLGGRSQAWRDLYTCLQTATGPTGDACLFDSADMDAPRYGSCPFYACYPYYLRLVNATGGRSFAPPLAQFEPTAPCEKASAEAYYKEVDSTPCISIPHLDNWKCAKLALPVSLSVQNTAGVISFIFLTMGLGYMAHMYRFRRVNGTKIPFVN